MKQLNKKTVTLPKSILIIGLICTVFFLGIALFAYCDGEAMTALLFVCISFLGIALCLAYFNCRIFYSHEGFTVKRFWGTQRHYAYGDITGIRNGVHEDYLYIGKRKITVLSLTAEGINFTVFAQKQYRKLHHGKSIPEMRPGKENADRFDLFNGHILNPGEFIFVYALLFLFFTAALVGMIAFVYMPISSDRDERLQVTCISCVREENTVTLTAADGKSYEIFPCPENFDLTEIESLCDGRTVLSICAEPVIPDEGKPYYAVKSVSHGATALLSLHDTTAFHRSEYFPLIILAGVFCVMIYAFIILSVIIGRHPDRFSRTVVKCFFKPEYVLY